MDDTFMVSKVIRFSVKLFDAVPIRRDQPLEAIRKTIEALESGHVVALFPEGQLTRSGALCELERGFELIARKAKCPILPMWVDGSWGSVFSFERGRYFRKIPHRVPYGLAIGVGEAITAKPDRTLVRDAMLKASSEAVAVRFPRDAKAARINAHQLTQLDALPRGGTLHVLEGEGMEPLDEFAKRTKGRVVFEKSFDSGAGGVWAGGEKLRGQIAEAGSPKEEIRFFDFGSGAQVPFKKENVIHLPCLAVDGLVVAMSLPHPPESDMRSTFQAGHKPGSWGKILPGWHIRDGKLFPGGLALPTGAKLDGECFLFPTDHGPA
jgi:acyl-[acyl-carrier-protein]-phospholipid O-acyltransferase/long-chain-fatty-acid--[acyl-carrier-protein] ligase